MGNNEETGCVLCTCSAVTVPHYGVTCSSRFTVFLCTFSSSGSAFNSILMVSFLILILYILNFCDRCSFVPFPLYFFLFFGFFVPLFIFYSHTFSFQYTNSQNVAQADLLSHMNIFASTPNPCDIRRIRMWYHSQGTESEDMLNGLISYMTFCSNRLLIEPLSLFFLLIFFLHILLQRCLNIKSFGVFFSILACLKSAVLKNYCFLISYFAFFVFL